LCITAIREIEIKTIARLRPPAELWACDTLRLHTAISAEASFLLYKLDELGHLLKICSSLQVRTIIAMNSQQFTI